VLFLASDESSKVIDAALGVLERGTWNVADAVKQQPWLPNGPIPLNLTWTRPRSRLINQIGISRTAQIGRRRIRSATSPRRR
jgi:Transmembrane protein of unknown function (DUF3556)